MKKLNRRTVPALPEYPERVIQFGEGNFLRAFVDWMIQRMNDTLDFRSSVAVVQPIPQGLGELINEQDGLYHLVLEGIKDGEPVRETELISCLTRCINPYEDHAAYRQLIESPEVRFVVSNTTEAGIQWVEGETADMRPQASFPGKMTALLHHRFRTFGGAPDKGLIILCCELIEDNGDRLRELVFRHAREWGLEPAFLDWMEYHCAFCSTLVDRIVPGFPRDRIDAIRDEVGFDDQLLVVGERYHNWAIKAPDWAAREFPADRAGLNVRFVDEAEQREIRNQKVRVLNGLHSATMPVAFLAGFETVREAMEDPAIARFVDGMLEREILPTLEGDPGELADFAARIVERFHNPFIRHEWLAISLNSMSKWETRVLPTLLDSLGQTGRLPRRLVMSLAAMMAFYRGRRGDLNHPCKDNADILELYAQAWAWHDGSRESLGGLVRTVLAYEKNWKRDLNEVPGLAEAVAADLALILDEGMESALASLEEAEGAPA